MKKKITRALISVSDKTGIIEFCQQLSDLGVELLSTGGTAKLLLENHIAVTEVSDFTGFPEIMAGRVKTLHPKIHGGILARRGIDDDVMLTHGIVAIDLVIVNLYPFAETIANPNCNLETAIENIDIGGPTMIRAAAKNYHDVAVIVDPEDYQQVGDELLGNAVSLSGDTRFALALKSFSHTAQYDTAIASYLSSIAEAAFPKTLNLQFHLLQKLRYGENPHQKAAFYQEKPAVIATIATAEQLQGKELSYNNIADADAALECVKSFIEPACVIVKHANPCGVAVAENIYHAYNLAYATDATSAFGGIIAFNRELDADTAQEIVNRQFVELIIAPAISAQAQAILVKKANVRVMVTGFWPETSPALDYKRVAGGLLVQERDLALVAEADIKVLSQRQPTAQEVVDLLFAWKVVKFVKSNAIVYAKNQQTIGIGAGQMSRVYSARIAGIKAADEGLTVTNSVMASDAFFPFRDGIDAAAEMGVSAIIQPGGSLRDEEIIAAANEHNIAMVLTGIRHFRH